MLRVKMTPMLHEVEGIEGGISTIVRAYYRLLPSYGVQLTDNDDLADLFAVHAGMREDIPADRPMVAMLHGLYWTGDYPADDWEYHTNASVVNSLRVADLVTVPSDWVAQTIRRDMHFNPVVLGHGIDLEEWMPGDNDGYVLWNKNRASDVCNPQPVNDLANRFPKRLFLSTFTNENATPNLKVVGQLPYNEMKQAIQNAGIYLATTKETYGIGTLEAMASGLPVLGYNWGGTGELVQHKVNGYLAKPGDLDDLAEGLLYCFRNRNQLSEASIKIAQGYGWGRVIERLAQLYKELASHKEDNSVAIIIPCYNYGHKLDRAVRSALKQSYANLEVVIVNNNSTDETENIGKQLAEEFSSVRYFNCPEQGVAHARNFGIRRTDATYICCLDADDTIDPEFIRTTVDALKSDAQVGVAYTKMLVIGEHGIPSTSGWPDKYDFQKFMEGLNQVPTCAVYRRKIWARLGGYRQRYAPRGQGSEDAEFYLRMGAIGYKGVLATKAPLFEYHLGGRTQDPSYVETDWRKDKPWILDKRYPFAAVAPPLKYSHPVRQYDSPLISVIIPMINEHEKWLPDALDSLESQHLRRWEAIVVCDGFAPDEATREAFPFAKFEIIARRGAGACRNEGVKLSTAPLLLFLDADDWLEPQALSTLLGAYQNTQGVIYSDYYGHATIDMDSARKMEAEGKLVEYWMTTGNAVFRNNAAPFDRARAIRQPDMNREDWYLWCLTTSMLPRAIHEKVGGFDEKMPSWEDWDYWIRIAKAGFDFHHVPEYLVHYRYTTGVRRRDGEAYFNELTDYLVKKYQGVQDG